ncbi:hypothetical protein GCM10009092_35560 [Bowmanella denitrificans]|uniref:Uncharacterized protein n=1 Tax=Bowmanella denitrificans TaxID=366582 RepID=A0ABN0XMZ4_9ALTE
MTWLKTGPVNKELGAVYLSSIDFVQIQPFLVTASGCRPSGPKSKSGNTEQEGLG